ncbi:MAG: hypothetical protein Q8Q07_04660 [Dehalococcoidales bacterium]|nr:hypothetical protein [Dehalococcoidales bacterium]MDZ4230245.1 hypothetical protein [Dehalococcoidales bacterium]
MSGSRLRIVFVISLLILGSLVMLAVLRPLASAEEYSVVSRESIIRGEDQWIIQLDIVNQEKRDMSYVLRWSSGGADYTEKILVREGRIYSHIRHVYPAMVQEGKVDLTIYREGEAIPFEQSIYYLK